MLAVCVDSIRDGNVKEMVNKQGTKGVLFLVWQLEQISAHRSSLLPPPPLSAAGAFPPSVSGRIRGLPSVPSRICALTISRSQPLLQS
jgi:hypothetical protein